MRARGRKCPARLRGIGGGEVGLVARRGRLVEGPVEGRTVQAGGARTGAGGGVGLVVGQAAGLGAVGGAIISLLVAGEAELQGPILKRHCVGGVCGGGCVVWKTRSRLQAQRGLDGLME